MNNLSQGESTTYAFQFGGVYALLTTDTCLAAAKEKNYV